MWGKEGKFNSLYHWAVSFSHKSVLIKRFYLGTDVKAIFYLFVFQEDGLLSEVDMEDNIRPSGEFDN